MSKPARCRRRRKDTFSRAFWRSSSSLSVSATCRRRLLATSACALPAMRFARFSVTPWIRLSVRCSPDRYGLISRKTMAAMESAASSNSPASISSLLSMGIARFAVCLGGGERLRQASRFTVILGALPKAWPGDARRSVHARDLVVGVLAGDVENDQILQGDHVTLHADHLGDMRDLAGAVAQARGLHDNVDRAGDHFADGFDGECIATHHDHGLKTTDGFAWRVGVQRTHRAVVTRIHGLQ